MKDWHHAPPPGSRSGVADYAEALRPAIERLGQPVTDLYHLGNNALHAAIYARALERPGVVVLHDAVLHHFLLGGMTRAQYVEEFVYNYGEWRRPLAESLWVERSSAGVDPRYFGYAMLRRVAERSRAVVVHNAGAARIARRHGAASVHVVPHYFEPAALSDPAGAALLRQRLGISQGARLFGIFGYLRETKRVVPCLHAFRRLHAMQAGTALLLAGEAVSPDLARLLETEAAHPAIHRLGHLSERELQTAADAVDCCLNLRYPGAGETSGIAIRMMGAGKVAILTAGEENSALPVEACLQVRPGVAESAELFEYMVMVAQFPGLAREIGTQARRHILEFHSLEAVARQYWQVLCSAS